ncbi:uncharacterized protein LOC117557724 isoform X1 [Gymnodraco acuticeps]|uniref:Uncharacterized protein LOC117557724 isoform X1 n=1 Tax=Gymnodraco acuticeps TaxID=8218 RepID=A0A6P8VGQ7_GYMAC|nr:uncharacterized protein LOC117557724 isoform X1 [Gymnodraco acuticeps]
MELEGLKRSLELLKERGVTLDCIVTDRHLQIQKFLRESSITQFFDVWHIEKGISKQLEKAAKKKDCEKLRGWVKSIRNHIYWTAATSTTGPERVAKWTSILNHVQDIHSHDDPLFPKCLHPLCIAQYQWMAAGTPAFHKLETILSTKRILKAVAKLSPHHQTSSLSHSMPSSCALLQRMLCFHFLECCAGKINHSYLLISDNLYILCYDFHFFFSHGGNERLYLAALHYNENAERAQATTSTGNPLYKLQFPKARKGECRAKPVKTDPTFRYVANLMDLIFDQVFVDPAPFTQALLKIPIPEDLCSQYERPDREEVISGYATRFNLTV